MHSVIASAWVNTTLAASITNATVNTTVNTYDYQGAAIYVAVILIWYSSGLALMLFLQVKDRSSQSHFFFDSNMRTKGRARSSNPFSNYHNIEADSTKKHILNELRDPERRQRLWKIYYSSREQDSEPHPRYYQTITADSVTIGRINRKLADIHRIDAQNRDDSLISLPNPPSNLLKASNKRYTPFRGANTIVTNNDATLTQIPAVLNTDTSSSQRKTQSDQGEESDGARKRTKKLSPSRFSVQKVFENPAASSTETKDAVK